MKILKLNVYVNLLFQLPETFKQHLSDVYVEGFISKLVEEKRGLILEKRERSFKPLMGIVMKEFRGKVDGRIVAEKLNKAIEKVLKG